MEIKIQCGCGVKFAFEVEPVQGRMPVSLTCPRCGADQTAQANQQISLKLAPPPLPNGRRGLKILNLPGYNVEPPPPVPVATPIPVAALRGDTTPLAIPIGDHSAPVAPAAALPPGMPPAPEAPAAPSVGGLKVNKTKKAETHAPAPAPSLSTASAPEESAAPKRTYTAPVIPPANDESPRGIMGWLKLSGRSIAGVGVGFLVLLKFLGKTKIFVKLIALIFGATAASSSSELLDLDWNFKYDDATQIYVKADDHQKVLDACTAYWKSQGKTVKAENASAHEVMANRYLLTPAHQGYVALIGSFNWEPGFVDGLAKDLSTQLNTTVMTFADTDQDTKGSHRFAVYEAGQKHFAHQYEYAVVGKELKDNFKVEGEAWVKDKGYFKPGKEGFAEFTPLHINLISHKLGLHWWDFPDQATGFHDLSE